MDVCKQPQASLFTNKQTDSNLETKFFNQQHNFDFQISNNKEKEKAKKYLS